jgi:hypothetical protein
MPQRPKTFHYAHRAKFAPDEIVTIATDGALPIGEDRTFYITKGSALAGTVAAPGAANIGRRLTFLGGSDFAHVVTFTGATLHDGTTGGHAVATAPAFQGGALTVEAVTALKWNVVANNLFVITT